MQPRPPPDAGPLRGALRANLAAWRGQMSVMRHWLEHEDAVRAAAVSPDGRTALTGTGDGKAWLWDVDTGRRLGDALDHPGPVAAVAFTLLTPPLGLAGAGLAYALAQLTAVAVIVHAYRRRFGFPIAAVLLPQAEDAQALKAIGRAAMTRLGSHIRRAL